MRQIYFIIGLLVCAYSGHAQGDWARFEVIRDMKSGNPAELAVLITGDFPDTLDKIRAIYYWVANNIEYDYKLFEKIQKDNQFQYREDEFDRFVEKEVISTLKRGKGICQNYAWLFESLCEYAGIEAESVTGWAKLDPLSNTGMGALHVWNAVKYNNVWNLIDATLGSGYLDSDFKFHYKFDTNWFFVESEGFLFSHFPREEKWQLSKRVISRDDFKSYPYTGSGFVGFGLSDLEPLSDQITTDSEGFATVRFKATRKIGQVMCFNPRVSGVLNPEVLNDGHHFELKLDAREIKNGYYIFLSDSQVLFSYRLQKG